MVDLMAGGGEGDGVLDRGLGMGRGREEIGWGLVTCDTITVTAARKYSIELAVWCVPLDCEVNARRRVREHMGLECIMRSKGCA